MEENKMPIWIKALIVLMMLPVAGFFLLLTGLPADHTVRMLIWFYPAYIIASGVCAWMCWKQRPEITWILLLLMLLSTLSIYYLALSGN